MTTNLPAAIAEGYTLDLPSKGFKVCEIEGIVNPAPTHSRRDFYKIVLATGAMTIRYGAQSIDAKDTFLFLANPHVPHAVVDRSPGENALLVFLPTPSSRAGNAWNSCATRPYFAWTPPLSFPLPADRQRL